MSASCLPSKNKGILKKINDYYNALNGNIKGLEDRINQFKQSFGNEINKGDEIIAAPKKFPNSQKSGSGFESEQAGGV